MKFIKAGILSILLLPTTSPLYAEAVLGENIIKSADAWQLHNKDDFPAQVVEFRSSGIYVKRTGAGGNGGGAFFTLDVGTIPIKSGTILEIEGTPINRSVAGGCGFKCSEHPVMVILQGHDKNGAEIRQMFGINYDIGSGSSKSQRGLYDSIPKGSTQKVQFLISDAPKHLVDVNMIYVGAIGWDFEGHISSVVLRDSAQPSNSRDEHTISARVALSMLSSALELSGFSEGSTSIALVGGVAEISVAIESGDREEVKRALEETILGLLPTGAGIGGVMTQYVTDKDGKLHVRLQLPLPAFEGWLNSLRPQGQRVTISKEPL